MANKTDYVVTLPGNGLEMDVPRWSLGKLIQVNSIMWALETGYDAGQPLLAGMRQAYFTQIILMTIGLQTVEELIEQYLGKRGVVESMNHLGNEIMRNERRNWLEHNGWDDERINKHLDENDVWKPLDITPAAEAEGENGDPPAEGGGDTKPATSSSPSRQRSAKPPTS